MDVGRFALDGAVSQETGSAQNVKLFSEGEGSWPLSASCCFCYPTEFQTRGRGYEPPLDGPRHSFTCREEHYRHRALPHSAARRYLRCTLQVTKHGLEFVCLL